MGTKYVKKTIIPKHILIVNPSLIISLEKTIKYEEIIMDLIKSTLFTK